MWRWRSSKNNSSRWACACMFLVLAQLMFEISTCVGSGFSMLNLKAARELAAKDPNFFFKCKLIQTLHMLSRFIIFCQLCLDKRSLEGPLQAVEMTAPGDAVQRVVLQEALVAASGSQTKSTKLSSINCETELRSCLMDSFCGFSNLCHMFERPATWTRCSSPSGAILHWRSCGIPQRYAPAVVAWDCVRASVCFLFLRPLSVSILREWWLDSTCRAAKSAFDRQRIRENGTIYDLDVKKGRVSWSLHLKKRKVWMFFCESLCLETRSDFQRLPGLWKVNFTRGASQQA